jgi:hypothetical protein
MTGMQGLLPEIGQLARQAGLAGYDPAGGEQAGRAIGFFRKSIRRINIVPEVRYPQ